MDKFERGETVIEGQKRIAVPRRQRGRLSRETDLQNHPMPQLFLTPRSSGKAMVCSARYLPFPNFRDDGERI